MGNNITLEEHNIDATIRTVHAIGTNLPKLSIDFGSWEGPGREALETTYEEVKALDKAVRAMIINTEQALQNAAAAMKRTDAQNADRLSQL